MPRIIFTREMDHKLSNLVHQYGTDNWTIIADNMNETFPGKGFTIRACRERWKNYLCWTPAPEWNNEANPLLLHLYRQYGTKWHLISRHFPGFSDNYIKNKVRGLQRERTFLWDDSDDDDEPFPLSRRKKIPIGDMDYSPSIRKGLNLNFNVDTLRNLFFASCQSPEKSDTCSGTQHIKCFERVGNKYVLCRAAVFFCSNPQCENSREPLTSRQEFDVDHIHSFQRHWDSLFHVDMGELKVWYNDINNLQIMCKHCNRSLGDKKR